MKGLWILVNWFIDCLFMQKTNQYVYGKAVLCLVFYLCSWVGLVWAFALFWGMLYAPPQYFVSLFRMFLIFHCIPMLTICRCLKKWLGCERCVISDADISLTSRHTPAYQSWQQGKWLVCCGKPCAFTDYAASAMLAPIWHEIEADVLAHGIPVD